MSSSTDQGLDEHKRIGTVVQRKQECHVAWFSGPTTPTLFPINHSALLGLPWPHWPSWNYANICHTLSTSYFLSLDFLPQISHIPYPYTFDFFEIFADHLIQSITSFHSLFSHLVLIFLALFYLFIFCILPLVYNYMKADT